MEGTWLRRRRLEKAHVGILLLFMCVFIPANASTQETPRRKCDPGDYLNEELDVCCNKCIPGFKLLKMCQKEGSRSKCEQCPAGQYEEETNYSPTCRLCRRCRDSKNEFQVSPCKSSQNAICRCKHGFYRDNIDSETYQCLRCSECRPDERERHMCTPTNDTICDCKEDHYRVNSRCESCEKCTTECKRHCTSPPSLNTKATEPSNSFFINVIAGVVAVVIVMFGAVTLITHKVTKHFTKRRLNHPVLEQSDVSPDSCGEVLIFSEEPSQTSSAIAHSPTIDQEVSNLPDCIPLEIKTSDLIYTVLDLVPVLQVKQLVRSLGVNDMEIEQAELDYRPPREARYQMLRVWAERGSRAGGGGRGGMLHRPLVDELLDKLRKMHLEQAAEELETKYDIQ